MSNTDTGAEQAPDERVEAAAKAAGINMDNEVERGLFLKHLGTYAAKISKQKTANKEMQDHGKVVKNDLGDHGFDAIKLAFKVQNSENGEAEAKARVEMNVRALGYIGVQLGVQGDLFEKVDRRPMDEIAYDRGFVAGATGKSMNAGGYDASHPNWADYARGWDDGQSAIFNIKAADDAPLEKGKGKGKGNGKAGAPADETKH